MAQNRIQAGNHMPHTLTADATSGNGILVGDLFGVALNTGVSGDDIQVSLEGVWELPKTTADVVTQGAPLYWDDTAKEVTTDDNSGANKQAGFAFAAAGNGDETVQVKLLY